MFVLRKLTLIIPVSALSIALTSCSIIPFPQSWNAAEETETPAQKTMAQLPKKLPNTVSAPIHPQRLNSSTIDTLAKDSLAQQASNTKSKLPANVQLADLDGIQDPLKSGTKTKNSAQAMAQNLLKSRKSANNSRVNAEPESFVPNAPKTYRLDGPQQMAVNTPQDMSQQNYYSAQMGYPVQAYPRNPAQFQPPQTMAQNGYPNNYQTGLMPPDLAPPSQKPSTDPKAVMEAVERMRARQVLQASQAVQPNRLASNSEEQTGTLSPQNRQSDPAPKGPLTFVQFERGSTLLNAAGQKSLASMLSPHMRIKKVKIYLNAGLGGEGEAYTKLSNANQRAQAISERIPAQFEVIRRFDPSLPNESVRLYVVEL